MTKIIAFQKMAPIQCNGERVSAEVDGYRNGLRLGKRILGAIVNEQPSLPTITSSGQYTRLGSKHYYVFPVFDRYTPNPSAVGSLCVCTIMTILIAILVPNYFKLLAIIPGIGVGASLLFIRKPHNVQLRWVQSEKAFSLIYDEDGYWEGFKPCVEPTPDNQWSEMPRVASWGLFL